MATELPWMATFQDLTVLTMFLGFLSVTVLLAITSYLRASASRRLQPRGTAQEVAQFLQAQLLLASISPKIIHAEAENELSASFTFSPVRTLAAEHRLSNMATMGLPGTRVPNTGMASSI